MKEKFYCHKCKKIFSASGKKINFNNYIYGQSWKWVADCDCGEQAEQYQPKKLTKKKSASSCAGNCSTCPYKS